MRKSLPTAMLVIAVCAAPVAIGGVHTVVVAPLAALLLVAAGLVTFGARTSDEESAGAWISLFAIAFFVLAVSCGIQLVPLPVALHHLFQATAAELWTEGWRLAVGGEPGWRPLSLDPSNTADRGLRWVALAGASIAAANLPDQRRWRTIYLSVLVAGAVALVVGVAVRLVDPTTFFGIYEPSVGFRGPSPFVSTNHAATFYGLCGITGFAGLALRRDSHPLEASISGVFALLFLALAAMHDSDAVMAALGVAVVIYLAGLLVRTEKGNRLKDQLRDNVGRFAYVTIVAGCVLVIAWWIGLLDGLTTLVRTPLEASESAHNRTELILAALSASTDHALVGSGGGAVDAVVGRYVDWSAMRPASIPVIENDPVEWLLTYGWIAGGIAILLMAANAALVFRRLVQRSRGERWVVGGAIVAYGIGVSLFHFPFLALGIAIPLVVALEGMISPRNTTTTRAYSKSGHFAPGRWSSFAILGTLVVLAVGFVVAHGAWEVDRDASAEEMIRSRPTDSKVFTELATRALRKEKPDFERARALARHAARLDGGPGGRLFLARVLGRTGQDTEAALLFGDLLSEPLTASLVRHEWLIEDLERAEDRALALAEAPGFRVELVVSRIAQSENPQAATDVVLELADVRPDDPALQRAAIETFLRLGEHDLAELWASSVTARELEEGGMPIGPGLSAKVALARGEKIEAAKIAAEALGNGEASDDVALVFLRNLPRVDEASAEDDRRAEEAMELVCQSPLPDARRRPCWMAEGWRAERVGEIEDATLIFRRIASRLDEPTHLAQFLMRHGRCLELQRFIEQMEDEGQRRRIADVAKACRTDL